MRSAVWVAVVVVCSLGAGRPDRALIDSARLDNYPAVRTLVQQKVDVNATDVAGVTALHWAVQHSNADMVALLVDAGANVRAANRHGVTPLELAAVNANAAIIERLLKAGADVNAMGPGGHTPLMSAAQTGVPAAIKVLLAHGADVNARQRVTGQTALMWAAAENNVEAIRVLVEAGAEVEAYSGEQATIAVAPKKPVELKPTNKERLVGLLSAYHTDFSMGDTTTRLTPFHFAVRGGHVEAAKALLGVGASVNRPVVFGKSKTPGMSPLVLAIHNAHFELAAYLLDQGADVNADAQGWAALAQLARMRGPWIKTANPVPTGHMDSLELARRLLARGANPNARMTADFRDGYRNRINWMGATPVFVAAKNLDLDLLRLLVAHGADPTIKTVDDLSPLMVASGVSLWNPGEDIGTTRADDARALEVAKFLVELGNDPKGVATNGETPLHGAAYTGRNSLVEYLVNLGADLNAKNLIGWTPLRIADGVHYNGFAKYQHHTAAFIRELMAKRGMPVPEVKGETELYYLEALKYREAESK